MHHSPVGGEHDFPSPAGTAQRGVPSYSSLSQSLGGAGSEGGAPQPTNALQQIISSMTRSGEIPESVLSKELQGAMTDQELTALLSSRQDIATSLADDLLAQFAHHSQKDSAVSSHSAPSATSPLGGAGASSKLHAGATSHRHSIASDSRRFSETASLSSDFKTENFHEERLKALAQAPSMPIKMKAADILASCKGQGQ